MKSSSGARSRRGRVGAGSGTRGGSGAARGLGAARGSAGRAGSGVRLRSLRARLGGSLLADRAEIDGVELEEARLFPRRRPIGRLGPLEVVGELGGGFSASRGGVVEQRALGDDAHLGGCLGASPDRRELRADEAARIGFGDQVMEHAEHRGHARRVAVRAFDVGHRYLAMEVDQQRNQEVRREHEREPPQVRVDGYGTRQGERPHEQHDGDRVRGRLHQCEGQRELPDHPGSERQRRPSGVVVRHDDDLLELLAAALLRDVAGDHVLARAFRHDVRETPPRVEVEPHHERDDGRHGDHRPGEPAVEKPRTGAHRRDDAQQVVEDERPRIRARRIELLPLGLEPARDEDGFDVGSGAALGVARRRPRADLVGQCRQVLHCLGHTWSSEAASGAR